MLLTHFNFGLNSEFLGKKKKTLLIILPKASKLLDATTFLWLKKGLSLRRLDGQLSTDTNYVTIMATDYHSSCPEIHFGHCSTEKKGKSLVNLVNYMYEY